MAQYTVFALPVVPHLCSYQSVSQSVTRSVFSARNNYRGLFLGSFCSENDRLCCDDADHLVLYVRDWYPTKSIKYVRYMPSSQRGHNGWDSTSTNDSFMPKLRKACGRLLPLKEYYYLKAGTNPPLCQNFRFLCPPWQKVQLESKELMAACLRKIPGLSKVKLIGDTVVKDGCNLLLLSRLEMVGNQHIMLS